jgi:DNA-directed RNA polymerase specialized sigma24 family protein
MDWSKRTDKELIGESSLGSHDAFKELVRRYEDRVAATVIGMVGSGPEAEDIGQEVFVRFYKHLDQFRGEAKLITYLTRIAINLSLNALRRRKRNRLIFWGQYDESDFSRKRFDSWSRRSVPSWFSASLKGTRPEKPQRCSVFPKVRYSPVLHVPRKN